MYRKFSFLVSVAHSRKGVTNHKLLQLLNPSSSTLYLTRFISSLSDNDHPTSLSTNPKPESMQQPGQAYSPRLLQCLDKLNSLIDWERERRNTMRKMRVDTKPILDILTRLDSPQKSYPSVHITGSKGKGTISLLLSETLQSQGFRTGLLTSPHVERVNERVRINGTDIDDNQLATALEVVFDSRENAIHDGSSGAHATWFDILTAAAFYAFKQAHIDFAIVEVGMGGKLDSTNVLDAPVCILSNVYLEHAEIIGPTRAHIATEKSGIVSQGASLVVGLHKDDPVMQNILEVVEKSKASILYAPTSASQSIMERNIAIAQMALDEYGKRGLRTKKGLAISGKLVNAQVIDTVKKKNIGRFETFYQKDKCPIVIDGAHVPESVQLVMDQMRVEFPNKSIIVILGMGEDKNLKDIASFLAQPPVRTIICTSVNRNNMRYVTPEKVFAAIKIYTEISSEIAGTPQEALNLAIRLSEEKKEETIILVTGSLHLLGAIRPMLVSRRYIPNSSQN